MFITVLGLGRMGAPMARNLIEAGHQVMLYDRTKERALNLASDSAQVADTVAEAVKVARVAITMVSDDAAEQALAYGPGGLLDRLGKGAIHLCMSSISMDASQELAAAHKAAGQGYVAAPVLGNPSAAAARRLWILAAGPDIQVNRCLPLLEALGQGITRVGPRAELAHALKLGASALTVAMVETLAEVLAYGNKLGFPAGEYLRVLNTGLMKSAMMDSLGGFMVRGDHDPTDQTLDLAAKDMELLIRAAEELKQPMPMTVPLLQQLNNAQARGFGDRDITALSLVRRQEAELIPPPVPPPVPPPAPEPPQPEAVTYPGRDGDATVRLDLWRTTHFEYRGGAVWAWVEGKRHATFWRSLAEVDRDLGQVLLVRIQRRILLSPQAIKEFKPLFAGRARVTVAGGVSLTVSRQAVRRLKFLM
jgi:3-hydroxyisobutyrate dehydrogenase-like beta-hydroxyacid dehydrogenase